MARMLSPADWNGMCVCWCCDPGSHNRKYRVLAKRIQRRREDRQWRRDIPEDQR